MLLIVILLLIIRYLVFISTEDRIIIIVINNHCQICFHLSLRCSALLFSHKIFSLISIFLNCRLISILSCFIIVKFLSHLIIYSCFILPDSIICKSSILGARRNPFCPLLCSYRISYPALVQGIHPVLSLVVLLLVLLHLLLERHLERLAFFPSFMLPFTTIKRIFI